MVRHVLVSLLSSTASAKEELAMPNPAPSGVARYTCAIALVALAVAARLALEPLLGRQNPGFTFILALGFAAWYGGLGPALLALALSALFVPYFLQPRGFQALMESSGWVGYMIFLLCGLTLALMGGSMRTAKQAAEENACQARDERARMEREVVERRRAEQSEREQREQLHATLSSVGDGVIVTDAIGRVASLNPVAEMLCGWKTFRAEGKMLKEVFRTRDCDTHRSADMPVLQVVEDGVVRQMDHSELARKDGSTLEIEHCTSAIKDERGSISGVVIVFRDVTERIRAERALRESEESFRQLADTMPQIVWTAGPDGAIDYFNSRWYEYTGLTPEVSLAHEAWRDVVHPDDLDVLYRERNRAVGEGGLFQSENRLRKANGDYLWHLVRSVPVPDESGQVVRRFGTATDIDDQKRAEEALRESEEHYRAVYNQAATGIAETDLTGRLVRANDRYCEIVGYSREELLKLRFSEITHPNERAANLELFERLVTGGPSFAYEKRYLRKDGTIVWSRMAVSLIRDSSGRPARTAAVVEDITDRKSLEGELQHRVEELAEADRRKDEFLATLAHELRNPLAPIRNTLVLMRYGNRDRDDFEASRAMAERQVTHLARLIDDLMDIARINRGRIELRKECFMLFPVVERAVESVRSALEERQHELTVSLPASPVYLDADPTRLEQVLGNLLNNAVKYTDPGGSIHLDVEREADDVVIRVRDTGIGIAAEMIPRITEMFVQVERRSTRAQGGLGIGLSLVNNLVELHGGGLSVRSDGPGKGSEFIVRLPALPAGVNGDRPEPSRNDRPARLPRRRVLIVDDNVDSATSLSRLLSRVYGQAVAVAHDGTAALEVTEAFQPEVVLLDIGMPGMDGYEVARRLRNRPGFEATLVALTGWGQQADRQRSKDAGFDRHLVKPVDPDDLHELLRQQDAVPG
jgi:PAS domain S-box-containing protein